MGEYIRYNGSRVKNIKGQLFRLPFLFVMSKINNATGHILQNLRKTANKL